MGSASSLTVDKDQAGWIGSGRHIEACFEGYAIGRDDHLSALFEACTLAAGGEE